jgi:hypothetical protein
MTGITKTWLVILFIILLFVIHRVAPKIAYALIVIVLLVILLKLKGGKKK